MRELTKSMLGFSLAMPLFGMRQMMEIAMPRDPSRPFGRAADGFDAVTGAAAEQMGGAWKGALQAGDRLQRGVVDLMLGVLGGDSLDLDRILRMTSGMLQTSIGAVGRGLGDCGCCGGGRAAGAADIPPGPPPYAPLPPFASPPPSAAPPFAAPHSASAARSPFTVPGYASTAPPRFATPPPSAVEVATDSNASAGVGAGLTPPPGWTVSIPDV